MTRTAAALCLTFSAFLIAPAAGAQEARKASHADTAEVTAVDVPGRTLSVGGGDAARRYAIDDATVIRVGGERIALDDVEVGDRIAVTATEEGASAAGTPVANTIEVVQRARGAEAAVGAGPAADTGPEGRLLSATLRDAQGATVGDATLRETPNGVLVRVSLRDLPPGEHAFHVHQTGRYEPPFESAGPHLAGGSNFHGFAVTGGPHAGDLPNLVVPQDGRLEVEAFASRLTFAELQDADGAALVVHARADDYRSQPSGDAGDRIACGVVGQAAGEGAGSAAAADAPAPAGQN